MGETANLMMFGGELRLPDQLKGSPPANDLALPHERVICTKDRLQQPHEEVRQHQLTIWDEGQEAPPLFAVGDMVTKTSDERVGTQSRHP